MFSFLKKFNYEFYTHPSVSSNPGRAQSLWNFPGGSDGKVSGSGRSPGEGNGNALQYSYLENPMDRGDCRLQSMGSQRVRHNWVTSLSLSFLGICRNLFSGLPQITKPMDDQISYVKWHHTVNPLHLMAAPRRTDCITLALMWCFICIVSRWTRIPVFFLD